MSNECIYVEYLGNILELAEEHQEGYLATDYDDEIYHYKYDTHLEEGISTVWFGGGEETYLYNLKINEKPEDSLRAVKDLTRASEEAYKSFLETGEVDVPVIEEKPVEDTTEAPKKLIVTEPLEPLLGIDSEFCLEKYEEFFEETGEIRVPKYGEYYLKLDGSHFNNSQVIFQVEKEPYSGMKELKDPYKIMKKKEKVVEPPSNGSEIFILNEDGDTYLGYIVI